MLAEAIDMAVRLEHALYDCLYLVLAVSEQGRVVTADRDFFRSASQAGYREQVELLTWR